MTVESILDTAETLWIEAWRDGAVGSQSQAGYLIHEIAEAVIPIYTVDLLKLAINDIELAICERDIDPAYDNKYSPVSIIAANLYCKIVRSLWMTYYSESAVGT